VILSDYQNLRNSQNQASRQGKQARRLWHHPSLINVDTLFAQLPGLIKVTSALTLEIFRGGCIGYPNRDIVRFLRGSRRLPKRGSAFTAEVLAWLIRGTTLRTQAREWRSAFRAKLAYFAIVTSAFGAAHRLVPPGLQADARVSPEDASKKTDERMKKAEPYGDVRPKGETRFKEIASSVSKCGPLRYGASLLFPGLIYLGLQPRFVGLKKLAKFGSVGE